MNLYLERMTLVTSYRNKPYIIIGIISGVIFILLSLFVLTNLSLLTQLDLPIRSTLRQPITPDRTKVFKIFTFLGSGTFLGGCTVLISALLIWKKQYASGIWMFVNVGGMAVVGDKVIKHLFDRPRPPVSEAVIIETGYSFPSGHSLGSMLFYAGLVLILASYVPKKKYLIAGSSLMAAVLILMVGWSRIYLGVHYPSDVLGGYSLGLCWLMLTYPIYRHFLTKQYLTTVKNQTITTQVMPQTRMERRHKR